MARTAKTTKKSARSNLKPFNKGKSGNKKGAPAGKHMSTILQELIDNKIKLKNPFTQKAQTRTIKEFICLQLLFSSLYGDTKATKILLDRTEGKVVENLNIYMGGEYNRDELDEQARKFLKGKKLKTKDVND